MAQGDTGGAFILVSLAEMATIAAFLRLVAAFTFGYNAYALPRATHTHRGGRKTMLRWLLRLLLVGLILAAIGFVVTRLMGQDEDFDDFDDLDAGFEFQETPVEIDVPADDSPAAGAAGTTGTATTALSAGDGSSDGTNDGTSDGSDGSDGSADGAGDDNTSKLTAITGIGPAYEARLQALGIESVGDLLSADASSLADQLGVIGGQAAVEDWIAQARQLAGDGTQDGNSNE